MSYRAVDFEVSTLGEISLLNYFIYINTKRMSSASEFENACFQTLDIILLFMQLGNQEELRQRMP